jgi:hypothetical protein
MFMALFARLITDFLYFVGRFRPGKTVEQLQQTFLDNQISEPPLEMRQISSDDHTGVSGDNPRTVRILANGRHEEHPRAVSRTTARRYRGEQRPGREDQFRSRLRTQAAHLRSLKSYHHKLADEHKLLECSHHQLSEAHQVTATNLRETQATCNKQQEEINILREKLRGASTLLDIRNQELKVAKTFLSKEDPFSTSDVVQSIRDLNSEIMQTAAHLAENLPLKRVRTSRAEDVPEGPCKSIFVTLVLPGAEVDVGSLELALQGFLVDYTRRIVNAWGFSQGSSWYNRLYSKVCETGTLIR